MLYVHVVSNLDLLLKERHLKKKRKAFRFKVVLALLQGNSATERLPNVMV